jgi:hypothetical protein
MTKHDSLNEAADVLNALPLESRPRSDGLDRILAARARGERHDLPTREPRFSGLRRLFAIGMAAAAILLASVILFDRPGNELIAGAISGELRFSNPMPTAGARIKVTYKAPENLAAEKELRLRARFRTRWDATYNRTTTQVTAASLERGRSGLYEGEFTLPPGAVYMAAAVENKRGTTLDDHRGYLWELIVHADGKPTYDALNQQFNDVISRSPDSALAIARRTTALHPEDPDGWANRVGFETFMVGPEGRATVLPKARELYASLDRTMRAGSPSPELIDKLLRLIPQIRDQDFSTDGAYWSERLLSLADSSATARYYRITRMNSRVLRDSSQAPAALDSVERYWNTGDSVDSYVRQWGFQIALRTRDSAAVFRWARRFATPDPFRAPYIYAQVAEIPRLRRAAIAEMRRAMTDIVTIGPARRELEMTVREDTGFRRDAYRAAQVLFGRTLLAAGDTTAGTRELRATTTEGWDLGRFEQVAQLLDKTGDAAAAKSLYAMIAVDPATPTVRRDSIRTARSLGTDDLKAATEAMIERVGARSISRAFNDSLIVTAPNGGTTRVHQLTGGRPAVILIWSRHCGHSRAQLRMLNDVKDALERQGVAFVPVTVEAPGPEVNAVLAENGVRWESYYDAGGALRQALHNIGTPKFYVLDRAGRIRFESSSPWLSVTQSAAIK